MNPETKIFQVISDLNLSGDLKKAGDFIEAGIDELADLVHDGVLRVIEGATSFDEAAQKVKEEADAKIQEAELEAQQAPKDTWAPTKEEPQKAADEAAPVEQNDTTATTTDENAGNANATTENAGAATATTAKYTVAKAEGLDFPNPADEATPTHVDQGVEVDLDPAAPETAQLLADGAIIAVPANAPEEDTGDNL